MHMAVEQLSNCLSFSRTMCESVFFRAVLFEERTTLHLWIVFKEIFGLEEEN